MQREQRRARRREIRLKATPKPGHEAWVAENYFPTVQLLLPHPPVPGAK